MLMSFALGTLPNAEIIPPEHTKIDVGLAEGGMSLSFEDFVLQEIGKLDCVKGSPDFFALDTNNGYAVEVISETDIGGIHSINYVNLQGRYFEFVTFGNLDQTRDIVRSLRPITSDDQSNFSSVGFEITTDDYTECYVP